MACYKYVMVYALTEMMHTALVVGLPEEPDLDLQHYTYCLCCLCEASTSLFACFLLQNVKLSQYRFLCIQKNNDGMHACVCVCVSVRT